MEQCERGSPNTRRSTKCPSLCYYNEVFDDRAGIRKFLRYDISNHAVNSNKVGRCWVDMLSSFLGTTEDP